MIIIIIVLVIVCLVLVGKITSANAYTKELIREIKNNGRTIDKLMENINLLNDKYRGFK